MVRTDGRHSGRICLFRGEPLTTTPHALRMCHFFLIEWAEIMNCGDEPVQLMRVPNDMEAAIIVNALANHGIRATATGGFTAGLRAEAPGDVQIHVQSGDAETARSILQELRGEQPDL